MAIAFLSSGRRPLIRSFLNSPLIRINPFLRPPSVSSVISTPFIRINPSCSAADPTLTGKETLKSWERRMEQQESSDFFPIKHKSLDADDPHTPAFVTCASVKENRRNGTTSVDWSKPEKTTLHFCTFNSDGALLKLFSVPFNLDQPYVVSACRNLLLLNNLYIRDINGRPAVLCNIATQDVMTFPDINGRTAEVMGFGYVPSTKEFKVLGGLKDLTSPAFPFFEPGSFKVLTLGTHRWQDANDPPLPIRDSFRTDGAFVNGAIHFLTQDQTILSFDLEREEWGTIAGPPVSPRSSQSLMELSGYLCMLCYTPRDIWFLDNHTASWIQLCTIEFTQPFYFPITPLGIENDGRILLHARSSNMESLLLCDPKTKSSREIQCFYNPVGDKNFCIKVFSSLGHR